MYSSDRASIYRTGLARLRIHAASHRRRRGERALADLHAPAPSRQHLAGVQPALRIEQALERAHQVEAVRRELVRHQFHLFHADPVLACNRTTGSDAEIENILTSVLRFLEITRFARIE